MSGEEDGTGDGSSVKICKENTATQTKQRREQVGVNSANTAVRLRG